MKALVGAFNQEKALVGAFSVIVQTVVEPMEHYTALIKSLDIPSLRAHADRVTVLDLLYNVGAQHGHQLHTVKIKMFDSPAISIEENYLTKRVLRGFHDVTTLVRSGL